MIVRNGESWTWSDLDDKTKVTLAAFAGEDGAIGDGPGKLPAEDFHAAYEAAFPGKDLRDPIIIDHSGQPRRINIFTIKGIRNTIINSLDRDSAAHVTQQMARLAWEDYDAQEKAHIIMDSLFKERQRRDQQLLTAQEAIRTVDYKTAWVSLSALGQMAMERQAQPDES